MTTDLHELAQRVATGDIDAFRTVVEQTSPSMYRLSARLVGNTADADDVMQEAYLKAFRAFSEGSFDGRADLRTWLYRVVTHTAIDALRRRKRQHGLSETISLSATDKSAVGSAPDARVALGELARWLDDLPVEQQAALVLSALEGLSNAEVAEMLGCSEGAVEQRLIRARATLKKRRQSDDE